MVEVGSRKDPVQTPFCSVICSAISSRTCTLDLSEQHLPLPAKYRLLSERFRSVDTIVNMLHKRKERCNFGKLKKAVEEMTRRYVEGWCIYNREARAVFLQ